MDFSQYKTLEFRRKFFKIFGAEISIIEPENHRLVGFVKLKAWRLREDIRIYSDKTRSQELMGINARQIIDFGATYDVTDSTTAEPLFSVRRKGLKSTFVRDHWDINNVAGEVIGALQETSSGLALARRYVGIIPILGEIIDLFFAFIPQTYSILDNHKTIIATITHRKNPFIVKMRLDIHKTSNVIDPRVGIAIATLLSVIDASKN